MQRHVTDIPQSLSFLSSEGDLVHCFSEISNVFLALFVVKQSFCYKPKYVIFFLSFGKVSASLFWSFVILR